MEWTSLAGGQEGLRRAQRWMRSYEKDVRAGLKGILLANCGTVCTSKRMTVMNEEKAPCVYSYIH